MMHAIERELLHQRELVHELTNEVQASRMEMAVLRADMQALEERLTGGAPMVDGCSHPRFSRTGINLQQALQAGGSDKRGHPDSGRQGGLLARLQEPRYGRLDDSASEDLEDTEASTGVSLEPNIWDCSMMVALHGWSVGREVFGKFNVIMTMVILAANTIVQALFVVAVKSMVDDNPFQDESMLNMRLQDGQLYANLDHKTMTTKAQQTCNKQSYNMLGETVNWVMDYLMKHQETRLALRGNIICLMAMITWTISVYSELRRSLQDLVLVVLALPSTSTAVVRKHGEMLVIEGVPRRNKAIGILVMVPRITIAVMLLMYGLKFLAGTIELRELLTNAVALEFIKSIDEMLFEAIMPRKLMAFVKMVKIRVFKTCLPHENMGGKISAHGYHAPAPGFAQEGCLAVQSAYVMLRIFLISLAIFAGYTLYLQPIIVDTQNAFTELCGEHTNFTWMLHPMTRVPIFANLDPYSNFSHQDNSLSCFYAAQYEMLRMRAGFRALYQRDVNITLVSLVNGNHSLCWPPKGWLARSPVACPEQSLGYMNSLEVTGESQYLQSPYFCRDQDVFLAVLRNTCLNETFFKNSPVELAFFNDVYSCRDLKAQCKATAAQHINVTWQWTVQKLCPEACGLCMATTTEAPAELPASAPVTAAAPPLPPATLTVPGLPGPPG